MVTPETRARENARARERYTTDPEVRRVKNQRARDRSREWTVILQASRVDPVVGPALKAIRERIAELAAAAEEKAGA
jgi:hypothetical protein